MVDAVQAGQYSAWLVADIVDAAQLTTNLNEPAAMALEARVASTIGTSGGPSTYTRLFIGGTTADAPQDIEVIHVNCNTEDMRFPALGPRILIDGKTIPIRDGLFERAEGNHIPLDLGMTPHLIPEIFRTLKPGGCLLYSPSLLSDVGVIENMLIKAGFVNFATAGKAKQTSYYGKSTRTTEVISTEKP